MLGAGQRCLEAIRRENVVPEGEKEDVIFGLLGVWEVTGLGSCNMDIFHLRDSNDKNKRTESIRQR